MKSIIGTNIQHSCSTNLGSSGSPILNLSNFKIIGVHKRGTLFNLNEGTFIKFVIKEFNKEISTKLNSQKGNHYSSFSSINNIHNSIPILNIRPINMSNISISSPILFPKMMNIMPYNSWISPYTNSIGKNIEISKTKMNLVFKNTDGRNLNLILDYGTTVKEALITYFKKMNETDLVVNNDFIFVYNASKINAHDNTPIEKFFQFNAFPVILVLDTHDLIGAK